MLQLKPIKKLSPLARSVQTRAVDQANDKLRKDNAKLQEENVVLRRTNLHRTESNNLLQIQREALMRSIKVLSNKKLVADAAYLEIIKRNLEADQLGKDILDELDKSIQKSQKEEAKIKTSIRKLNEELEVKQHELKSANKEIEQIKKSNIKASNDKEDAISLLISAERKEKNTLEQINKAKEILRQATKKEDQAREYIKQANQTLNAAKRAKTKVDTDTEKLRIWENNLTKREGMIRIKEEAEEVSAATGGKVKYTIK